MLYIAMHGEDKNSPPFYVGDWPIIGAEHSYVPKNVAKADESLGAPQAIHMPITYPRRRIGVWRCRAFRPGSYITLLCIIATQSFDPTHVGLRQWCKYTVALVVCYAGVSKDKRRREVSSGPSVPKKRKEGLCLFWHIYPTISRFTPADYLPGRQIREPPLRASSVVHSCIPVSMAYSLLQVIVLIGVDLRLLVGVLCVCIG